ncbi:MAG TPA: tyrosine-type recombinase/integrase [Solirubrobacteraceae bacterium]|nr:tyrosine-type recombinase/integrase [Solirubrobacteraceae bacterium]
MLGASSAAAASCSASGLGRVSLYLWLIACAPAPHAASPTARSDLDVDRRELAVRFSVDGTGVEKAPKNGKPRVVTVPPPALRAIRAMPVPLIDDYLFHTARGRRLSKGSLSYMWRPIAKAWQEHGGRDLDLYELRHAAATLLLARGVTPGDVAIQLGHQDGGRLVQTLYGHPAEDLARDRLRMAFAGESDPSVRRAEQARG